MKKPSTASALMSWAGILMFLFGLGLALWLDRERLLWWLSLWWTLDPTHPVMHRAGTYIWVFPVALAGWLIGLILVINLVCGLIRQSRILLWATVLAYVWFMYEINWFANSYYWISP